jgi:hypothetical protein
VDAPQDALQQQKEVQSLPKQHEMLKGLRAEGSLLFSEEYYLREKAAIKAVMKDITIYSVGAARDWKQETAAQQIIDLYKLMHADPGVVDHRPKGKDFLDYMTKVLTRLKKENDAGSIKKRGRSPKPPPVPIQTTALWDPDMADPFPCPACGHFTVMQFFNEDGATTDLKRAAHKAAEDEWNALPADEKAKRPKPVLNARTLGGSVAQLACMCCVMNCMNGSSSCPQCVAVRPVYGPHGCPCEQCKCKCNVVFTPKTREQVTRKTSAPPAPDPRGK